MSAVSALETHARTILSGEDIPTNPGVVVEGLEDHGLLSYSLVAGVAARSLTG